MWLFTKYGFYSAVCAERGDGSHDEPLDPERLMVRARLREHLEALKHRFPNLLGGCEIMESSGGDYSFRIFASKPAWVEVVAALAEETDYDNFKNAVAAHQNGHAGHYSRALHGVWDVMAKTQARPPYSSR